MWKKNAVVYGIYAGRPSAENAVLLLKARKFRDTDISVMMPDSDSGKQFAHEKRTKAPEGAMFGSLAGAVIGAVVGYWAGVGNISPLDDTQVRLTQALVVVASAGFGGAVGWIFGAVVGLAFPEYEAKRFDGLISKGGILLSVHCDDADWVAKARHALKETGAKGVSVSAEARAAVPLGNHGELTGKVS